jgi:hypothetical protein
VLSGDVHHCYLAEVGFPKAALGRAPVWQATCSPFRNPLGHNERRAIRLGFSPAGRLIGRALTRASGVPVLRVGWRLAHEQPFFDNQLGTLELDGRRGHVRFDRAAEDPEDDDGACLEPVFDHRLDA